MTAGEWSKSYFEYGCKLVNSGLEGAHQGEEAFLQGEHLAPFLGHSARKALTPAAIGACLGAAGSRPWNGNRCASRTIVYTLFGGLVGFAIGLGWESRRLTASVASSAMKNMEKTRDEHWLEKNPIDYA